MHRYVFGRLFGVVFFTIDILLNNITNVVAGTYLANDPINCILLIGALWYVVPSVTSLILPHCVRKWLVCG